ncbi:ABC transporter permease [Calderihabitans maritimus]|uniref:Iron export ABC transporter permease subunit FetB n=1 Tax=Calderihabitans maritimus TaxID=1246530 RepID=A0A1Z5HNT3_9FIRM|nr:iron export ABC transporter permease subunit FetB [Calderihabitans maritimus]GAW91183.1 hypothetical protein KKC1_03450 [Calderihabitans maritimus]
MEQIINIGTFQLMAAYVFILILLLMVRGRRIGYEKEIILAAARMTIQLILVGYILTFIFDQEHVLLTISVFVVMEAFAIQNIFSRVKSRIPLRLKKIVALSMILGTSVSLGYFLVVVINLQPWYEAQYFIPIAGMIIGNSMTGVSLGVERLISGMKNKREQVEGALMLGATPKMAAQSIVNDAFAAAILPTINSMVGMGIVFLPGMMTGQILSGVSPLTAIEYQIAIMLGILGSVSLTVFMLVQLGYKAFFNERSQLELPGGDG